MKQATLLTIIFLFVLIFGSLAYFFYSPEARSGVELSISIDKTDPFKAKPEASDIFSVANVEEDKWSAITIRLNAISNFDHNTAQIFTLPSQQMLLSNPGQRNKAITGLKKQVVEHVDSLNNEAPGRPRSNVYVPMVRVLNQLAKSNAKKRIAVFYTDCQHNTDQFSIYNKKHRARLNKHPEDIQKYFHQLEQPAGLDGVAVFIVFTAKNQADNEYFSLMSGLFKKILEGAGAEVFVGANIKGAIN